ncbi:MAG: ABC transporter substrate-binding protein [Hyphomicrobiaceae bacterium]
MRCLKLLASAAVLSLLAAGSALAQKTLNIGMAAADVGQLDPHKAATTQDKPVVSWIFNGLVRLKPGSAKLEDIEPDLAEKWTASADKLVWTFNLRKGVKFHGNYGELTADDVVFSLQRAGSSKTSSFSADYASVDKIEAVDPLTVKITLKSPIPSLLGIVANYHGGNIVSKKAVEERGDNFRIQPIGTGPFAFEGYKPNESVTLVGHAGYFRGKPKIDKIVYRFIPSDSSRDLAFESGELDLLYGRQDQLWVDRMKKKAGVVVDAVPPGELGMLSLNMKQKPLDDVRVRRAIAYAVDPDGLAAHKGKSVATAAQSMVPIGYLGQVAAMPMEKRDIAKAKALLAEAGYKDGIKFKVIQTQLPTMLSSMQVVQAQLKEAGIDMQLEVVDHQTFHANIRKDLSQGVYYAAARFPVADVYLTQFFHSKSIVLKPTAVTNFSHCDVADKEIEDARVSADPVKQKELWAAAQKKIAEAVCAVPLFEALQVWARSPAVDYGYKFEGALQLGPVITELTDKKG